MALLQMENISISFYGTYANDRVCLSIEEGEIHALLGENGAGKTTLMNILFGIYKAESGRILWGGKEARFSSPQEAIKAGIGMVHQHFSLANALTVLDNILLGLGRIPLFIPRKQLRNKVLALSAHYGLKVDPDAVVGELSIGEKQRVEILKALMRDIKLLILDEPTAVLTPGETEQLFSVLRQLKRSGFTVILITHHMSEIMRNTDRVTVLRDGKNVACVRTQDVTVRELSHLMVGRELETVQNTQEPPKGETLLTINSMAVYRSGRRRPALEGVDLTVREGEILGVAGVEGNGQKELAEAIAGIRRRRVKGSITLGEDELTGTSVRRRTELGVAYIPDDRHHDALVPAMDIGENMILRDYAHAPVSKCRVFRKSVIRRKAEEAVAAYSVRTAGTLGVKTPVKMLSGGNQQKIILAREISPQARLIVASQPTRGLDVSASAFVHERLLDQRRRGKAVVLISADLDEIRSLSDRVAVMYNGRIAGILPREEATVDRIGLLMSGMGEEEKKGATA